MHLLQCFGYFYFIIFLSFVFQHFIAAALRVALQLLKAEFCACQLNGNYLDAVSKYEQLIYSCAVNVLLAFDCPFRTKSHEI